MRQWMVALCASLTIAGHAMAHSRDGTWTLVDADCSYKVLLHEQSTEMRRRGVPVETIAVRAGTGTHLYLERPVQRSRIVEDLVAGVWVRADRQGLQVLGRVVLPRARDPKTGRPHRLLIAGQIYENPGRWQQLRLAETPLALQRSARVLRAQTSQAIDLRGAYLDSLVLNVFGGPGITRTWIDQVELEGRIDAAVAEDHVASDQRTDPSAGPPVAPPRLRIETLQVDGRPFFPRVIEYRGEPFELFSQLGFNTVFLEEWPTEQQQQNARRRGLWLVCPPPEGTDSIPANPPVLAWFCGEDLSQRPHSYQWTDQVRRRDPDQRPLIAGAVRSQWVSSRQVDILLRRRLPVGTSMELAQFGEWLQDCSQLVRPGTPFWSSVQTELSQNVLRQVQQLMPQAGPLPTHIEAEQMRQLALASLAAGARGLWFASDHRLDAQDPSTEIRRWMLERLNLELALAAPWAMGGQRVGEVPGRNSGYRVVALSTERSRLLIPNRVRPHSQLVCPAASGANSLVVAGVPESIDVYLLTPVGLRPVRHKRISGGFRLETDTLDSDALILLSQDPLVVSHVNREIARMRDRAAELEYKIADWQLQDIRQRLEADLGVAVHVTPDLDEAEVSLQTSQQLLQAQDAAAAYRFARQAESAVARIRTALWEAQIRPYGDPMTHPGGTTFSLAGTLPQTVLPLTDKAWSRNLMASGDCEQLPYMVSRGWRQHQQASSELHTQIALSPRQPHSGNYCLQLRSAAKR